MYQFERIRGNIGDNAFVNIIIQLVLIVYFSYRYLLLKNCAIFCGKHDGISYQEESKDEKDLLSGIWDTNNDVYSCLGKSEHCSSRNYQ